MEEPHNFSTLHPEKIIFASTSFPQNSFSSSLRSGENVNSPLQSTKNEYSSTLRYDKFIKYRIIITIVLIGTMSFLMIKDRV